MGCGAGKNKAAEEPAKAAEADSAAKAADAAEAAKAAPNFAKYFEIQKAMMDGLDCDGLMALMAEPAPIKEGDEKTPRQNAIVSMVSKYESMKEELKVWAANAFDNHDKDKNEFLDLAEAKVMFQNYISLYVDFLDKYDLKQFQFQMAFRSQGQMMGCVAVQNLGESEEEMVVRIRNKLTEKRKYYEENKAACDEKSFAVLDHSGDSKVYKKDVVDALTLDSVMFTNVHVALGLMLDMGAEIAAEAERRAQMADMSDTVAEPVEQ